VGIVVPFSQFKSAPSLAGRPSAADNGLTAVAAALHTAGSQLAALHAAKPLLDECRDRFGFVLMRDGLPDEPILLARSILELYKGLCSLDTTMGVPRTYPSYGVYLGRSALAWFEDGYSGETGLAVPFDTTAADIASFIIPRVSSRRAHSND
jgi:hypothetical protein